MVNIVRAAVDHPDADSPLRWSLEVEVDSSVCRNYLSVEFNLVLSSRLLVAATENGMYEDPIKQFSNLRTHK